MRSPCLAALAMPLILGAGCRESGSAAAVFELVAVDGRPLPYVYEVRDITGPYEVVTYERSYALRGSRWWTSVRLRSGAPHLEPGDQVRVHTDSGTLSRAGDTLTFYCAQPASPTREERCLRAIIQRDTMRLAGERGGHPSETYVRRRPGRRP